jgi:trehalose 6-phosphate phosphatase
MNETTTNKFSFDGAILDMDGVITRTAILHAKAWKEMFDELLKKKQGADFEPLDINEDYNRYIDGIPRHDGIRNFLESRNIILPEGHPGDPPSMDTVYGLGTRKNEIFLSLLDREGVQVYEDTLSVMKKWKEAGIKLAVISSSRNCRHIIGTAGLLDFFDAIVDGESLIAENLKGKPEPDMFLRACELLGTHINRTIVIEDAISGIEAGVKGNFGLVVGIARNKSKEVLKAAGADIVISTMDDLVTHSGTLRSTNV